MEKHQHIRALINAVNDYSKHQSEATASALQMNLAMISASIDLSIFDPGSCIAADFYVSLHELMNTLGSKTTLIWSAVDVLQTACRNTAARQALTHTYKFAPILTRLLEAQNLTAEKRIRALKLLQELTYGIKISWQETHLPYLITTLTQWVTQSTEEEVLALSLGVLTNLCYKNLPAVYTLMRTIDSKMFVRILLKHQSLNINTRVQCCKLLIILEHINTELSEKSILDFTLTTFKSIIQALEKRDVLLLRHIVDFFEDVRQKSEHSRLILLSYSHYQRDVAAILATLENDCDPECVALMMDFLQSLVKLKITNLISLYPSCIKCATSYVPMEQVCSKALSLIRTIVIDSRRTKTITDVLSELDISILMLIVNSYDEEQSLEPSSEKIARLNELMQLLQEIVKIDNLRGKVFQSFTDQTMRKLLKGILNDEDRDMSPDYPDNISPNQSTTFYVHALALTSEMAQTNSDWLTLYSELMRKKQIHMTMAMALFTGDEEVKQKVLQLPATVCFPQECLTTVAHCMGEIESLVLVRGEMNKSSENRNKYSGHYSGMEMMPFMSHVQEERLNVCIDKLNKAHVENKVNDVTTSAVIELYEYKLAAIRNAERSNQASLEAANNRVTSLQHQLAQVIAESRKLHQLLFRSQQSLECLQKEKSLFSAKIEEIEKESKRAYFVHNKDSESLKKIVSEKSAQIAKYETIVREQKEELNSCKEKIEVFTKKVLKLEIDYATMEKKSQELSTKNHEMSKLVNKTQEGLSKKEQIIEEKNVEITSLQEDKNALKQEMQQLSVQCNRLQVIIKEKEEIIQKYKSEVTDFSRMRDMIFELTAKKKEDLNST
ncbi:protein CIP2A homolog [Leptopilina heterotoma]|uniref:protein CIP2A homolog n=1 Tax=Leptopilina heterotoma TaxID=63436 RepID=UPI001CA8CC09|nr:protein CIP2A homolog [Leptopilina heterotoma]